MAVPAKQDLTLYRGDTFRLLLTFNEYNEFGELIGTVNLTGWLPEAQIRVNDAATEILAEIACTVSNQTTNEGEMTLYLEGSEVAALPDACMWDLQVTMPDDDVITYLRGSIKVSGEITR